MSTQLLICDDSNMARKQVARSLPEDWDVEINFANDGVEGIAAIKAGKGDVLLLDLNMPKMDGYEVLEVILKEDLPTLVVVVSGDIQPTAYQRVKSLGALDFIKKPVNKEKLTEILIAYGLFEQKGAEQQATTHPTMNKTPRSVITEKPVVIPALSVAPKIEQESKDKYDEMTLDNDLRDCYQEIANVAMGRAGDLLARLLNVFVKLPIPNVNLIEVSELSMALKAVESNESISGICQGFIGGGISGEALLILNDSSFQDVASLMNYEQVIDERAELELLMDIANVLIGACLSGISEQLDLPFSQGHPVVLGQHCNISDLVATNIKKWHKTLAIEISYGIEGYPIKCDILLLFTEKSMKTLNEKVSYLLD
ncbi:MAG: response regulator [Gammaproteobacteria bacterium]|nr:MAG: response regulator [Gammaproteobacteria bacterium]